MNAQFVARQTRLQHHYREAPEDALITECARTANGLGHDPFHAHVEVGGGAPGATSGTFNAALRSARPMELRQRRSND